jgi:hypothetical protein
MDIVGSKIIEFIAEKRRRSVELKLQHMAWDYPLAWDYPPYQLG